MLLTEVTMRSSMINYESKQTAGTTDYDYNRKEEKNIQFQFPVDAAQGRTRKREVEEFPIKEETNDWWPEGNRRFLA